MSVAAPSVYYLRISLADSEPLIWRDFLVPSNLTLENLHYVIQTVMGWENAHAHQFIADHTLYSDDIDDFDFEARAANQYDHNEQTHTLAQLLNSETSTIFYEYDLGDSWMHRIELKKIIPANADNQQIRCINGGQSCPPEDCGGIWGYSDLLNSLQYAEDDEVMTPFGRFNPEQFDIDAVNLSLKLFNLA